MRRRPTRRLMLSRIAVAHDGFGKFVLIDDHRRLPHHLAHIQLVVNIRNLVAFDDDRRVDVEIQLDAGTIRFQHLFDRISLVEQNVQARVMVRGAVADRLMDDPAFGQPHHNSVGQHRFNRAVPPAIARAVGMQCTKGHFIADVHGG